MFISNLSKLCDVILLLLLLFLGLVLLFTPLYSLCHVLYSKGWLKSNLFALSLEDISRYRLLSNCRYYYKKKKELQASEEWLEMEYKCATANNFFPISTRIQVEAMLKVDYFYTTYFNLAEFTPTDYLEMYDDFVKGKYKKKELYEIKARLQEKLPKCLQEGRELEEMCLLVDNGWLDTSGQPIIKKQAHSSGRFFYEIVLACYFISPDNYIPIFSELWGKTPDSIKSQKSAALGKKNSAELCCK